MAPPLADQRSRPYTIELVLADRGWILEKIANAIAREAATSPERFQVTITTHPSGNAELTFFLPESAWRDDLRDTIRVTYLAHKEDHSGAAALFQEVARKSDYCVTSSSMYADALRECGAREVFTIPLGVDTDAFVPKVRIGVVGRTYNTGRKGESLLAPSMDLPFVEFVFTGEGWPLPAHYYNDHDLAELYQSLDYLLVPSLIEGGPVPMLEALSSGCPVIAATDVGMVRDFPHIAFKRGDALDLRRVIQGEVDKRQALRATALPCDWRDFAHRHLDLFEQLIDRKRAVTVQRDAEANAQAGRTKDSCRALLLTHGVESSAKGGPTTRVRNIIAHLRGRGLPVDTGENASAISADRYDVIHVFNIWPPDSALSTLAAARRSGATVVFSPIALDLADWPIFYPFLEKLFASNPNDAELRAVLERVRLVTPKRRYEGHEPSLPTEGIPGLFEKLRLCCDLAHRLVFLSEFEQDFLNAIGARTDHGVLIRNGVDVENMIAGDPDEFRKRFGLERYILGVGRLEYRKNQALAALAARDIGATLVLIGAPGDTGYVNHVRVLGGRNVRILDRMEDRQLLASAYAGADAFVFPSWIEGAPLAAMEAGAAGTPLVLSEMSSEREYFGNDAIYVHPADIAAIGSAVRKLLERRDGPSERRARAKRLSAAFSIARHADETWDLYGRAHAKRMVEASPAMVMDVSSLLHFIRVGQPLTGVPTAEWNILKELVRSDPSLRCIVYNDVKGHFIQISIGDLTAFDEARFNARHWFTREKDQGFDRRGTLFFADSTTPVLSPESRARPQSFSRRTKHVGAVKAILRRLPSPGRNAAVSVLRRWRPEFDPFQRPPDLALAGATAAPAIDTLPQFAVGTVDTLPPGATVRFEHPLATLWYHDVPRVFPAVPVGARLLTLGQSWLSNAPLLDDMVRQTQSRALSLEAYVYDLTYHTGAHLTGWADNGERFNRLLKLLRHCERVYTESRQVENELQKLRLSRGLRYYTRRTKLRGRDLPDSDPRGAPSYDPETFVLMVSSFNKRKNHDFLIEVWRDLYETWIQPALLPYRLVLVGPVQEERKFADPAFVALLRQSNIDVHTEVSDGGLAYLMRQCAFTVYPSLQEGWGLPVQESLMCGKVCLVSDSLPVAQEITNPALIRLSPADFYGWHEAMRSWLDNAAMRRAFSDRAKEYVPPTWSEITEPIRR